MARTIAHPNLGAIQLPQVVHEKVELLGTDNFDLGWIGDLSPNRIPDNAFSDIQDFVSIRGRWITQNGILEYSLGSADANKVLNIAAFDDTATGINLLRYDREKIYKAQSTGWLEFTASGVTAISGGDYDYFSLAQGDGRNFFSNNGVDPIREIDPVAHTYIQLGNAPRYRYITTAFNRVVGAYSTDSPIDPIKVGWSGDLNYGEWDPLVDISAGSLDLVNSPSDTSDDITGIFNISTFLIVTRQRSIFIGQNQASATQPFFFYSPLPKIGADLPRAISLTDKGLVWYNFQQGTVFFWEPPNGVPEDLSAPIRKTLKNLIESLNVDPREIYSSYSLDLKTWSLFVHAPSDYTYEFSYDFTAKRWYKSIWVLTTTVADIDFSGSDITIDELIGTISALAGSIDQLGGLPTTTTRFMGWSSGAIYTLNQFSGDPVESIILYNPPQEAFVRSKLIEIPIEDTIFTYARWEYTPFKTGTVVGSIYANEELNDIRLQKFVTVTTAMLNKPQLLIMKKPLHLRQAIFLFGTTTVSLEITGFYVNGVKSGVSSK